MLAVRAVDVVMRLAVLAVRAVDAGVMAVDTDMRLCNSTGSEGGGCSREAIVLALRMRQRHSAVRMKQKFRQCG